MGYDPLAFFINVILNVAFDAIVVAPWYAGIVKAVLNGMRNNNRINFGDVFFAYLDCNYYWRYMCLTLVTSFFLWVLYPLIVIPGILWVLFTCLCIPLHQELHPIGVCRTISTSTTLTCRYFCTVILMGLMTLVFICAGLLFFIVGIFITAPAVVCSWLYFYRHIFGVNGLPLDDTPNTQQRQAYASRLYM